MLTNEELQSLHTLLARVSGMAATAATALIEAGPLSHEAQQNAGYACEGITQLLTQALEMIAGENEA